MFRWLSSPTTITIITIITAIGASGESLLCRGGVTTTTTITTTTIMVFTFANQILARRGPGPAVRALFIRFSGFGFGRSQNVAVGSVEHRVRSRGPVGICRKRRSAFVNSAGLQLPFRGFLFTHLFNHEI